MSEDQNSLQDLITDLALKWTEKLCLQAWHINLHFLEHGFPNGSGLQKGTCAAVGVDWPYLTADIEFDMPVMASEPETTEEDVIHELLHIVMAEVVEGNEFNPKEERVVTRLARTLVALEQR